MAYRAVIFDLGGVVFPSPFDAFTDYERSHGLPDRFIRTVVAENADRSAWAGLERGELSMGDFIVAFSEECKAAGGDVDAAELMTAIAAGFGPRPEMTRAIARLRDAGLRTAALTNNWAHDDQRPDERGTDVVASLFDVVVESAVVGLRKPDPRIYEMVLRELEVDAPAAVFLDDLGINLKPARALGMRTIKVGDPDVAIDELQAMVGIPLRG